jgi:hypothetical protein
MDKETYHRKKAISLNEDGQDKTDHAGLGHHEKERLVMP